MTLSIETLDLEPNNVAEASLIWCHGLGADGRDFLPMVQQFPFLRSFTRFIFPHAPIRPITLNGGMKMRGWYDISSLDRLTLEDTVGVEASQGLIHQLIKREQALGIDSQRIVLGGFSQGGAMALHAGLRYPDPLGGVIALSCYLPLWSVWETKEFEPRHLTPIWMGHGVRDEIVPFAIGARAKAKLEEKGYSIDWHAYDMGHTVIDAEIDAIGAFLKERLQAPL